MEADPAVLAFARGDHFAGLRHRAAPISARVLAEQLRELQADGLVDRVETGPVPAPVVYRLTSYGVTALPLVETVRVWGVDHLRHTHAEAATTEATGCQDVVALVESPGVVDFSPRARGDSARSAAP